MRLTNFKRSHGNHRSSNFTLTCTSPSYVAGLIADSVLHCIALFQQGMRLLDREPQLLVFSVTTFKIDQNKNQNRSIDKSRIWEKKNLNTQRLSPRFKSQQFFLNKMWREIFHSNFKRSLWRRHAAAHIRMGTNMAAETSRNICH